MCDYERNLILVDGELCAITPGPNLVPANSIERKKREEEKNYSPEKRAEDEIPV